MIYIGNSSEHDPYWVNTQLLLHFEGTNGTATFTDSSSANRTIAPQQQAQLSTANFKFGASSGLFDGTGDYLSVAQSGLVLGANDFTIEFWMRTTAYCTLMYKGTASTTAANDYYSWAHPINGVQFNFVVGSNNRSVTTGGTFAGNQNMCDGNWHNVAITRSGGTMRIFENGTLRGSDATLGTDSINNNLVNLGIGGPGNNLAVNDFSGNMDEFRITVGVARYTSSFTPATKAFPNG